MSVRQYALDALLSTFNAVADGCIKSHPEMSKEIGEGIASLRQRAPAALDVLLKTEQFRSLSSAEAPTELVETSAFNANIVRTITASRSRKDCTDALAEIRSTNGEKLNGALHTLLFYTKAIIDMKTSAAPR